MQICVCPSRKIDIFKSAFQSIYRYLIVGSCLLYRRLPCSGSVRRTSDPKLRLTGQFVIVQFHMMWYLLVFILLSLVDSIKDNNQICGGIPFVNLSPFNSELYNNFRPDYNEDHIVYALFPERQAPDSASRPFTPHVACSTRNNDQTSSEIPSVTLSIGNSVSGDTFRIDHIENRAVQVLSPESEALETVSFPYFSGNSILSNQPHRQITTNPILPLVGGSTGSRDRISCKIPAINVSPGKSVKCDTLRPSSTEEWAVQGQSPESLPPGIDSYQFFSEGQTQSHRECRSTMNPTSQILASTGNSDDSSNCIPVVNFSPVMQLGDTFRRDNIADLSGQYLVPESQPHGTALLPLSTGGIPSNEPVGQLSPTQQSQTGNGSTPNNDQSYIGSPELNWFFNNDFSSKDVFPVLKKRKIERLSFNELQSTFSDRIRSPLAFAVNWPTPKFVRPDAVIRKVSEKPLFALEVFFNSRRNTQTQTMISYAVRNDVVIAIDNYLQECRFLFPHTLRVMTAETRQIAEYIVGHDDKNLISCFSFASLSRHQQQKLVRSAPMSFKMVFPPSVAGILATMSIVFRSTKSCGYHYPTLKLFWNASVKLLELHGANGQDFIYCLKLHIMERCAYASGATRSKRLWNRDESVGNCLHIHLSLVLQSIANRLVIAAMTLPEANRR
uniref:Uncharacterized protein n=1 Tax=Spongospora subterranea TaxID=70186 RepID=A0A0H5QYZ9_9EUKA|eukprot:CRZ06906.1 hypothetical protein [Spongospora subterranea]